MKVIDLLNLVYNKKAPKKILYKYCEYELNPEINDYKNKDGLELFSYLFTNEEQALFLEVEIIEEKQQESIQPLAPISFEEFKRMNPVERYHATIVEYDKIEELRVAVNYLLKKEDE